MNTTSTGNDLHEMHTDYSEREMIDDTKVDNCSEKICGGSGDLLNKMSPGDVSGDDKQVVVKKFSATDEYYFMYHNQIERCRIIGGSFSITYGEDLQKVENHLLTVCVDSKRSILDRYPKVKYSDLFRTREQLIYAIGAGDLISRNQGEDLSFKQYQIVASSTKFYGKGDPVVYPSLKLNGEAGEVAEKVGKVLRDNDGVYSLERSHGILKELGDCLWYINAVATDLGFSLQDVAEGNMEKILDRRKRNVISGSGDNR